MPEPLRLVLNISEENAARTAAFVYLSLRDLRNTPAWNSVRAAERSPGVMCHSMDAGNLDTLSMPDGTVERVHQVLDNLGLELVGLVTREKEEGSSGHTHRESVPVGDSTSVR